MPEDKLRNWARIATEIRKAFSERARRDDEEKYELVDDNGLLGRFLQFSKSPKTFHKNDFTSPNNPGKPNVKRRTMRQLDSNERLAIVTEAAKRNLTH